MEKYWSVPPTKKVKIDFWTQNVTWKFHVGESTESIYDINLGRDTILALGIDIECINI